MVPPGAGAASFEEAEDVAQFFVGRKGGGNMEEEMEVVGHDGCLPEFYLGVETMELGQFLCEDDVAKWAEDDVWEVCLPPWGFYVSFEVTEEGVAPFDAKGYHVETAACIVLP